MAFVLFGALSSAVVNEPFETAAHCLRMTHGVFRP